MWLKSISILEIIRSPHSDQAKNFSDIQESY